MKIRFITACLVVFSLTGCSSAPREVEAGVPLVNTNIQPIGFEIPKNHISELEDPLNTSLHHQRYKIEMGPFYTSSLGQDCRELVIYDPDGGKTLQAVCTNKIQNSELKRSWYLIPNIIQKESNVKL